MGVIEGKWYLKEFGAVSYFKDGKPEEFLKDHVDKGLEAIDLFSKRYYHLLLAKRFRCDSEVANGVLYAAYIMHDVGKCVEKYQRFKKSFIGHEFYSAGIIFKSELDIDTKLKEILALTAMLHHHTMPERISGLDNKPVRLCQDGKKVVEKILKERTKLKANLIDSLDRPYDLVLELVKRIKRELIEGTYALLIPVMVADDYAASSRGGNSCLGREAVKVVSIYKTILEESE
ncbi:MAG: HD domain-containing protein [Nitrososphaerota archaeon]